MAVTFEYWGEHELRDLLLGDGTPRGYREYWFGEHILSIDWMRRRLNSVEADVGQRYTPKVHVALPKIVAHFDALCRTDQFYDRLNELYTLFCREWRWAQQRSGPQTGVLGERGPSIQRWSLGPTCKRCCRLRQSLRKQGLSKSPEQPGSTAERLPQLRGGSGRASRMWYLRPRLERESLARRILRTSASLSGS